ncbi:response regulator transcription factor [Asticcacaulis sp. BYS171W]|uniref:Response regulator transcription factor n=1 Tax=Asticcacaulis aquaticus TaxID=2984212 RepID=A0ABT5HSS3_9CAUL|nr:MULTISPECIES: response regulator transcription factor [Asticcacaulis]ESQ81283.1 transcriptional regulator [Asticcacaulis sp. YBE204]MDC7683116.1 response regulator transcription factor [Asticcacaulis aquaticus]
MIEKKNTILVVDDEDEIRKMLNIFLDVADFKVVESENGKQAIRLSASVKPDLILLDLGLPDIDGKEVIQTIRQWSNIPIIVLTARSEDMDAAAALNLGADDYVTKPFSAEVLLARINANLRKSVVKEVGEPDVTNGPIRMDLVRHEVFIEEKKVPFTPKEYDLLRFFLVNRGRMLTHKQILKEVWGPAHVDDTQYLRVYIGQVREKLEAKEGLSKAIVSESGIGYRMEVVA